jgi:hypothetical protein
MLKKGYPHQLTAWALLASLVSGYASPAYAARRANKRVASEKSAPAESVAKGDRGDHADEEASEREPADKSGTTVLAQGFLLQLASSDDARLNGSFRIRPDGVVDLPYSVSLHAAGSSLARFRAEVLKAYKAYFNEAPSPQARCRVGSTKTVPHTPTHRESPYSCSPSRERGGRGSSIRLEAVSSCEPKGVYD